MAGSPGRFQSAFNDEHASLISSHLSPDLTLDDSVNAPARIWETIANVVFPSTDVVADPVYMQTHLPYMEANV